MANKQINAYTAANSIDATNDYLLIDPGGTGAYKKINRNTIMVVTGTPADISSVQSFTNKTLDNTNAITIKDGSLTLQNTSSVTKQAVFDASLITAGQTRTIKLPDANTTIPVAAQQITYTGLTASRTYTMPDAAATLVGRVTTDTLTNKTIVDSTNVLGGVTMTLGSDASGDVYYRNVSGVLTRVAAGSTNTVLTMGASSVPAWAATTSQVTLLKANSGTDTNAGSTNVDTFAITGLTAKDTLMIYCDTSSVTQQTATPVIYSVTDSVILNQVSDASGSIAAGSTNTGSMVIRQSQQSSTVYNASGSFASATTGAGTRGAATTGVCLQSTGTSTAWTGSWTIALRHQGVTAGGTFRWSWSLYKIAGQ